MRFNIKDYEKAFPRKAEPTKVIIQPEEKVDSVIEGSSEDPDTLAPEPKKETQAPDLPPVGDPEGGEPSGNE